MACRRPGARSITNDNAAWSPGAKAQQTSGTEQDPAAHTATSMHDGLAASLSHGMRVNGCSAHALVQRPPGASPHCGRSTRARRERAQVRHAQQRLRCQRAVSQAPESPDSVSAAAWPETRGLLPAAALRPARKSAFASPTTHHFLQRRTLCRSTATSDSGEIALHHFISAQLACNVHHQSPRHATLPGSLVLAAGAAGVLCCVPCPRSCPAAAALPTAPDPTAPRSAAPLATSASFLSRPPPRGAQPHRTRALRRRPHPRRHCDAAGCRRPAPTGLRRRRAAGLKQREQQRPRPRGLPRHTAAVPAVSK